MYPVGAGGAKARTINNNFVEFGVVKNQRTRVTLAQLVAGFTLLPALPGVKWRLLDAGMIAVGATATTATSVNIIGTRAGSAVQLVVNAVSALTRSTWLRMGAANSVILADGASHTACDANTPITVIGVTGTLAAATAIDVILTFVADPA
jgi:hypothetical protein